MKNNTKLIMETWRRFLKEGLEGIDEDGMVEEMHNHDDASSMPPVEDEDLAMYGDPAHMGSQSSAPMLPMTDEDDDDGGLDEYDTDDEPYITDGDSLNPDIAYDSGSFDDSLDMMP